MNLLNWKQCRATTGLYHSRSASNVSRCIKGLPRIWILYHYLSCSFKANAFRCVQVQAVPLLPPKPRTLIIFNNSYMNLSSFTGLSFTCCVTLTKLKLSLPTLLLVMWTLSEQLNGVSSPELNSLIMVADHRAVYGLEAKDACRPGEGH